MIGDMRQRVTIQRETQARDAHGGVTRTWSDVGTRWASVQNGTGREFVRAKSVSPEMTHLVKMRYYNGLTTKDRLTFKGRTLNIESIADRDERERYYELVCRELV
jgi:SPP1 family predicted phage head-tail adaptor